MQDFPYFRRTYYAYDGVGDNMPEKSNLIVRWAKVRHEHQMEKHEFAEKILGISRFQYYDYENGKTIPTLEKAIQMARKANRTVDYIYRMPGDPED